MFQKNHHDTGENQFSAEQIVGLVSIKLCQIMEQLRPKTGNPLANFVCVCVCVCVCVSDHQSLYLF